MRALLDPRALESLPNERTHHKFSRRALSGISRRPVPGGPSVLPHDLQRDLIGPAVHQRRSSHVDRHATVLRCYRQLANVGRDRRTAGRTSSRELRNTFLVSRERQGMKHRRVASARALPGHVASPLCDAIQRDASPVGRCRGLSTGPHSARCHPPCSRNRPCCIASADLFPVPISRCADREWRPVIPGPDLAALTMLVASPLRSPSVRCRCAGL